MRIGGGIIKVFIFFISLFLLTEVLFLISPKIINIQKNKDTISKIFKEQSGESINFNTASFKTYPDFSVKIYADNIEIKDILKTDRFEARIWLPKLIVKKLSVKNLIAENVKLYVVRNQDNTTNIDNFIYNTPFKIDTNKINFNVNNYKLFFADKVVEQNIQFEGEKLFADINKSKLKIDIKGDLRSGKHFSDIDLHIDAPNPNRGFEKTKKYFSVTGYIKNLHPEIFKEYFKLYDKDIYDVKGVINAEFKPEVIRGNIKSEDINISIEGLKILSKIPEKSIIFSNKNIIKSHIHFDKHNLITDSFEFSGDKFKIKTTGKITGWGTKSPKLDLNIDIDEARAEELYWMLPSNLFTEELEILKIKKYGAYGDVKGSLQLKGDILKPDVYGAVDFDNVWVLDGLPPEVPKAIVKTNFKKDKVYVDVKVWATPLEFVKVVGWSV